mmetsp:Transcript_7760/g.11124  ORF Transcript_7760/g.11124 Transcript_7760/m.11124 type:complete len:293 (+) Transcript_7760:260-1138(+)
MRISIFQLVLFCSFSTLTNAAFHARIPQRPTGLLWLNSADTHYSSSSSSSSSVILNSINKNDFDEDNDGFVGGNDDGLDEKGQALAKEFSRELKLREEKAAASASDNNNSKSKGSSVSASSQNKSNAKGPIPPPPQFPRSQKSQQKPKFKKFTGVTAQPSNTSAGLFSGSGDRVYSVPNAPSSGGRTVTSPSPVTARDRIIEQEFRLLGRPEQAIAVQALFAVAVLSFYVYVGLTGGITDRIEPDTPFDWDSLSDNISAIEELTTRSIESADTATMTIPAPTTSNSSGDIWL